jgi:ketosteroid isomerase-like protein/quercetin dioxygenase-like cupin family protein
VVLASRAATAQTPYTIGVTEAARLGGAVRIDVLVDSARLGSNELELAEITFPAGGPAAPHRHGATELLYVMQGELDHTVNGVRRRLSPGMVGIVRLGDTVTHRVASPGAVRALVIWTPAGEAGRLVRARGGASPTPITSIAEQLEGLRTLREEWSAAYNAGRLEPLRDMYTAAAVRMPYDAPAQVTRDSVLAGYARSFADRTHTPTIRLTAAQVEISGDVAIERGAYDEVLTPKKEGRALREVGKYVSVLRRGDDGRWRFEWSIFNRDLRPGG